MPLVDIVNFPKLILMIPQSQFPDNVKIVMKGRVVPRGADGKTLQLAADAKSQLGIPQESPYSFTTWTESTFSQSNNGYKVAEVSAPYDEIISVVAYAHRKDFADNTPIDITIFTTRSNNQPSATNTTFNLDKVWAVKFSMTKQTTDASYVVQFVEDTIPIAQAASIIAQFASFFGQIIAKLMAPSLPSPKAIASKLLGPASAPIQSALATIAEQYAKVKPTVDQITAAATAITAIAQDPKQIVNYLPAIMTFLIQFVGQDKIAEIIYDFKGGG